MEIYATITSAAYRCANKTIQRAPEITFNSERFDRAPIPEVSLFLYKCVSWSFGKTKLIPYIGVPMVMQCAAY